MSFAKDSMSLGDLTRFSWLMLLNGEAIDKVMGLELWFRLPAAWNLIGTFHVPCACSIWSWLSPSFLINAPHLIYRLSDSMMIPWVILSSIDMIQSDTSLSFHTGCGSVLNRAHIQDLNCGSLLCSLYGVENCTEGNIWGELTSSTSLQTSWMSCL